MMKPVVRVNGHGADAEKGTVLFSPRKAIWNLGVLITGLVLCVFTYSHQALLIFATTTYLSLLIGHSVGMHRMMIHRAFESPKWVERALIYIGVLVGMSGPFGVIKIHDMRDWAQRQESCHPFFSHTAAFIKDLWWQLTCEFSFEHPPTITIEDKYRQDRFLIFLEKTWRLHQIPPAMLLYYFGGWNFVVWGLFLRVGVSILGHWTITYFCHNPGPGKWQVIGASVQGSNLSGLGVLTYGECWHNNHHAFPESARIGLEKGQADPAWRFIQLLSFVGLAKNIRKPRSQDKRGDLIRSQCL